MNIPTKDLISKLRSLKTQTGSIACFGCGYEHNCGINGCRLVREAADRIENLNNFLDGQCGILLAKNGALMTAMQAINNAAVGFVEGGPYHDGEATAALFAQAVYELSGEFLTETPDRRPPEGEEDIK